MPLIWAIIVSIMVVGYMRIDNLTIRLDNEKQRSEQLEEKVTQIAKSYNQILKHKYEYDKFASTRTSSLLLRYLPKYGNKFGDVGQFDHQRSLLCLP